MPAVQPSSTSGSTTLPLVLVTGASSYLGAHIVRVLLARGYAVRATVRSSSKASELRTSLLSSELSPRTSSSPTPPITPSLLDSHLTTILVPDISTPTAFDAALSPGDVSFVVHTASPSILRNPNASAREITRPAVDGTVNLLESARRVGGIGLKRVVITSSAAAFGGGSIVQDGEGKRLFTEEDWDPVDTEKAESGVDLYRASKVLAEQAAWAWYETHKPSLGWDLTILLPAFMFGPPLYSSSTLGGTHKMFLDIVVRRLPEGRNEAATATENQARRDTLASSDAWLDVRDAAEAHVRALETDEAVGRVVLAKESFVWQEWVDAAVRVGKEKGLEFQLERGAPEVTTGEVRYPVEFDTSKEKRLFAMEWRTKDETMRDLLVDAVAKGWV